MNIIKKIEQIIVQNATINIKQFNISNIKKIELNENHVDIIVEIEEQESHNKQSFYKKCLDDVERLLKIKPNIMIVTTKYENIKTQKLKSEKIKIKGIKHIIAVMSGKGGVGKSTISAYTAVSFANTGKKVALVDGDIYGPSIPAMFGTEDIKPEILDEQFQPIIIDDNIATISIGNIVNRENAVIWRGPMAVKAMYQLMNMVDWKNQDLMIIDLPPGTGDIYISLFEKFQIDGAILITTPQKIALNDVIKSVDMLKKLNIPIIGVIENMSYLMIKDEKKNIFGEGGGRTLAEYSKSELIECIPLDENISKDCDEGKIKYNEKTFKHFNNITNYIVKWLENHEKSC